MSTYLITGGAGFVGSHIAQKLIAENQEVRVIDDLSCGTLDNLMPILNTIEFIQGDITDFKILAKAMSEVDFVIHQAARISVIESIANPALYHHTNVTGTLQVLEQARISGVKRVVLASSSAVYGKSEALPLQESIPVTPISPYAMSKYMNLYRLG